ncbi:MAG: hypothetical protein QXT31_07460 [Candidatus Bathyarchaeia archaeon]
MWIKRTKIEDVPCRIQVRRRIVIPTKVCLELDLKQGDWVIVSFRKATTEEINKIKAFEEYAEKHHKRKRTFINQMLL